MNSKKIITILGLTSTLLFTGCSTSNIFGVGHDSSSCESSKNNGFCGAPSSILKYKDKIKQMQSDYLYSGYPKELFFAISRDGVIGVKEDREDKWQPYEGSKYEKEINRLLAIKAPTQISSKLGTAVPVTKNTFEETGDLAYDYRKKETILETQTNVGRMIRTNGEYTKTWVAPYKDKKGDLVSAHELYIVTKEPEWTIGEKTPKKVVEAATPEEHLEKNIYQESQNIVKYNKKEKETLNEFLQGN